ncbi:MAG: sensor histidine kinase [Janthinobacterium lividum]
MRKVVFMPDIPTPVEGSASPATASPALHEGRQDSQETHQRRLRAQETVIPDCCNLGVVVRTLMAVNGAALAATLLRSESLWAGVSLFLESSFLLELATLSSLLALCTLRRPLSCLAPVMQRMLCAAIPLLLTAALILLLRAYEPFLSRYSGWSLAQGVLGAALGAAVLQHYFELRQRAFSPALAQARLAALQARIRPHFLFNSLNAVLSLIRSEPRQAERALEDLCDLFRVLLRDARDMGSLEQEIHLCRQYLAMEQLRLGQRLQVEWELVNLSEEVLARARIPSLLLQPLVENAVHHGVEPVNVPVKVMIRVARVMERIEITLVNPYHVGASSGGNHMALANIRERLLLLFDVEASLSTAVVAGHFEVRLRIPYTKG